MSNNYCRKQKKTLLSQQLTLHTYQCSPSLSEKNCHCFSAFLVALGLASLLAKWNVLYTVLKDCIKSQMRYKLDILNLFL